MVNEWPDALRILAAVRAFTSCRRCGVAVEKVRGRAPICRECLGVLARAPTVVEADRMKRGPRANVRAADVRAA